MPEHPETPPSGRTAPETSDTLRDLARKAGVVAAVALGVYALYFFAWEGAKVLLLAFAGLLLGTLFRAVSCWLRDHSPLSYKGAFGATLLGVVLFLVLGGMYLVPRVDSQVGELAEELPAALERLDTRMESYGWYRWLEGVTPSPEEMAGGTADVADSGAGSEQAESGGSGGSVFQGALRWLQVGFGGIAGLVLILFTGLYFGAQPDLYRRGILRLFPLSKRPAVADTLDAVDHGLKGWLLGQMIAMAIIGVAITVGLMLLGIPLALTFGILAALLTFIPNFGPVLSALPPTLLALAESPRTALWVVLLFLGVQIVESYFITPMIQFRVVDLPPALILLTQVFMGLLFGFLGLAVATPLAAAGLILVQEVWVKRALGDDLDEPPEGSYLAAVQEG